MTATTSPLLVERDVRAAADVEAPLSLSIGAVQGLKDGPGLWTTFCTPLHVTLSLLSCFLWGGAHALCMGQASMFKDVQAFLQCSVVIAGFHCIVADNARVSRVLRRRRRAFLFYGVMNAATVLWSIVDHFLPPSAFIMLSSSGLSGLSAGAYVMLAAALFLVLFAVGHQVAEARTEMKIRGPGWWLPPVCFVAAVSAVTVGAVLARPWGNLRFHIHHYMWAGLLALFMRYESNISVVSQAVALGIFNEELCYGSVHSFFDQPGPVQ